MNILKVMLCTLLLFSLVGGAFALGLMIGRDSVEESPSSSSRPVDPPREQPMEQPQGEELPEDEDDEEEGIPVRSTEELAGVITDAVKAMEESVLVELTLPQSASDPSGYLSTMVEDALYAVRKDNPTIFWMGLDQYRYQWRTDEDAGTTKLRVELQYYLTEQQIWDMNNLMDQKITSVTSQAPADRYEAVKHFHDWIVNNTTYNTPIAEQVNKSGGEYAYNITGVLINGSAVCEGYAKTFKVLCDKAGIPCEIVIGEAGGTRHAWNYVQLDGAWYLVDTTFDDPVSSSLQNMLLYDYFLRGSGGTVDGSYISELYRPDAGSYPTLSRDDYAGGTHRTDDEAEEGTGEVFRVDMQLADQLVQGGSAVAAGGLIGNMTAVSDGGSHTFELTGEGQDDHRFVLGEDGRLLVGGSALSAGSYQIKVRVYGGPAPVTATINLEVKAS